jgi:hypothetical protein
MSMVRRFYQMPYSWLDRQGPEERLTFNTLVSKHLRDITIACGALELIYSLLSFINQFTDRELLTVDSTAYYVDSRVNAGFWAGVFAISGILVIISLKKRELRAVGMAITAACLLIWGLTVSIRSMFGYRPILMLLGLTAITIAVIAYKVCLAWHVIMFNHKFYLSGEEAAEQAVKLMKD